MAHQPGTVIYRFGPEGLDLAIVDINWREVHAGPLDTAEIVIATDGRADHRATLNGRGRPEEG